MKDKEVIRKEALAARRKLSLQVKNKADKAIAAVVLGRPEIQKAKIICIYESFSEEVSTKDIITDLKRQKKKIVTPPISVEAFKDVSAVDVFIVPGVAFDPSGYRLGRGGGYYDRLLARTTVPKIGIAYGCQIVSGLPRERYDIPMDTVITEKATYEAKTP